MTRALSLLDIAAFRAQGALDTVVLAQVTWLVDGAPDVERLQRLARHLANSRQLGRVIIPASILGGRDHWGALPAVPEVAVETETIDRAAVMDWVNIRTEVPILPSSRPWHLAARPFTDGGHAVTLVVSHALTDGLGLINALASAGQSTLRPYAGSRPGPLTGIREAITGLPAGLRAALAAARASRSGGGHVSAPVMTVRLKPHTLVALADSSAWHAAAAARGGSSNALFVSVAAQVATAVGRVTSDGTVIIGVPVNNRAAGDDVSANALTTVELRLDADRTRDVAYIRAELNRCLAARREEEASFVAMLPIVPFLPVNALRPLARAALGSGDPVTTASHVGVLAQPVIDAAGPATAVFLNLGMQYPAETVEVPERVNALFTETAAGTTDGTVAVHLAVASDRIADRADLRAAVLRALTASDVQPSEIL